MKEPIPALSSPVTRHLEILVLIQMLVWSKLGLDLAILVKALRRLG